MFYNHSARDVFVVTQKIFLSSKSYILILSTKNTYNLSKIDFSVSTLRLSKIPVWRIAQSCKNASTNINLTFLRYANIFSRAFCAKNSEKTKYDITSSKISSILMFAHVINVYLHLKTKHFSDPLKFKMALAFS